MFHSISPNGCSRYETSERFSVRIADVSMMSEITTFSVTSGSELEILFLMKVIDNAEKDPNRLIVHKIISNQL